VFTLSLAKQEFCITFGVDLLIVNIL